MGKGKKKKSKTTTFKSKLGQSGELQLTSTGNVIRNWTINVLPDNDPTITFAEEPGASNRGTLDFAYTVEDDYGASNGASVAASYSSRGPSNGGITKPDLSGPTDTVGFTYEWFCRRTSLASGPPGRLSRPPCPGWHPGPSTTAR